MDETKDMQLYKEISSLIELVSEDERHGMLIALFAKELHEQMLTGEDPQQTYDSSLGLVDLALAAFAEQLVWH